MKLQLLLNKLPKYIHPEVDNEYWTTNLHIEWSGGRRAAYYYDMLEEKIVEWSMMIEEDIKDSLLDLYDWCSKNWYLSSNRTND